MEEAMMERILTSVATVALTVGAMIVIPSLAAGQTAPPIRRRVSERHPDPG
jgi:hypothetical protein